MKWVGRKFIITFFLEMYIQKAASIGEETKRLVV